MRVGSSSPGGVGLACVALLLGLSEANAVSAQQVDSTPPAPSPQPIPKVAHPHWIQLPTGDDIERYYPKLAASNNISGQVIISCIVTAAGTLDPCSVVKEDPPSIGLGAAGLELSKYFKMSATSNDGQSTAGATVVIPIKFALPN
jgi:TonB family protein